MCTNKERIRYKEMPSKLKENKIEIQLNGIKYK